jgi:hypothetical protein
MTSKTTYDPAKRKRCVSISWRTGRRVRILHPAFDFGGKLGTIRNVDERFVYVRIKTGKKPGDWEEVAYLPGHLRLV